MSNEIMEKAFRRIKCKGKRLILGIPMIYSPEYETANMKQQI